MCRSAHSFQGVEITMKKNGKDSRPSLPPIRKIEVSEERKGLRIALAAVFLVIGAVAIIIGLVSLLNTEPGWQEVQINANGANCAGEFVLMYDFSDAGASASAVNKRLTSLYSQAAENAYRMFSPDVREDGLANVGYLNGHVNEIVTVDPALYKALTVLTQYDCRYAYLAPAYAEYDRVFSAESDAEAARYDPAVDPELAEYLAEIAAFAGNPDMVNLETLGDNRVRLTVSPEYLQFAEENEIETLLDFGWMKNAFIADYLADTLEAEGFTSGYLSSYDGFTLPAGDYDAVRIIIGAGEGHNWWCVMYPPLCLPGAENALQKYGENAKFVTGDGFEIRFAFLEWLESLKNTAKR